MNFRIYSYLLLLPEQLLGVLVIRLTLHRLERK